MFITLNFCRLILILCKISFFENGMFLNVRKATVIYPTLETTSIKLNSKLRSNLIYTFPVC